MKKKKILTAMLAAVMSVNALPVFSMNANAAQILSDCSNAGYYMVSPENNIRSAMYGDIIGHLEKVQVFKVDDKKFIRDDSGFTWVKITDAVLKETGKKADGYVCLSYCYYMGTDKDRKNFEVANTAPALESFYSDSKVVDTLEAGDSISLLATGDAQLYNPVYKYWVNACDLKEAFGTTGYENGTNSPYFDYSALDYSCNEGAFFNENQKIIYMHFISRGYPETAACAIAVNTYNESGCRPTAWCIDTNGLTSYGICQWNGSRYERLKAWCSERGYDYTNLYSQLEYLDWELDYHYTYVRDKMFDTSMSAGDASYYWAAKFEVCSSRSWNKRAAEADSLYYNLTINRPVIETEPVEQQVIVEAAIETQTEPVVVKTEPVTETTTTEVTTETTANTAE